MRLLATTYYKGTNYSGWQKQPNASSVQEEIEKALSRYFSNSPINIYGSGRTDAGVHAFGQTFHFDVDLTEIDLDRLIYSVNQMLPEDIKITDITQVDPNFHARISAKKKIYQYLILIDSKDPFLYERMWLHPTPIDKKKLQSTLTHFVGEHNFKNFTSKEEDDENFIRNIYDINVISQDQVISITFVGDGFMRYMIRYIVGTAVKICDKQLDISVVDKLLDDNSPRNIVDSKAPACGLSLLEVIY